MGNYHEHKQEKTKRIFRKKRGKQKSKIRILNGNEIENFEDDKYFTVKNRK